MTILEPTPAWKADILGDNSDRI